jgi:hypothetical protein
MGTRVTSTQTFDPAEGRFASGPVLNKERFKLSKAVVALKDVAVARKLAVLLHRI